MNVRVESVGPCRRELHIQIPPEQVQKEFESVTLDYVRAARIPGFRQGRAPKELVRRRFQKEIADDVKQRLIPQAYQSALKSEKLAPVHVIDIQEQSLNEAEPYTFTVVVDVKPDVPLPNYKGLALTRKRIRVTEEKIDEVLETIRQNHARFEDAADHLLQLGDMALIDAEGVLEGRPMEEVDPALKGLGSFRDVWYLLDDKQEPIQGLSAGLIGSKSGERREIPVEFPSDFQVAAIAGKKAVYFVTVKAAKRRSLPEINDDFAKSMNANSVQELRDRIRADLASMYEAGEQDRLQVEVIRTLLSSTSFDLPQSELAEETRDIVYDIVESNRRRGISDNEIASRKEEVIERATKSAEERLKLHYIIDRIAEAENITVEPSDIDRRIQAMSLRYQMPEGEIRKRLDQSGGFATLRKNILLSKTLNRILELAQISEEESAQ